MSSGVILDRNGGSLSIYKEREVATWGVSGADRSAVTLETDPGSLPANVTDGFNVSDIKTLILRVVPSDYTAIWDIKIFGGNLTAAGTQDWDLLDGGDYYSQSGRRLIAVNVSGIDYIHVLVTAISAGTMDLYYGKVEFVVATETGEAAVASSLDGDKISVDTSLTNVVSDVSPAEVTDPKHLGAILKGIDNDIGLGLLVAVRTEIADYLAAETDFLILCNATTGPITVDLPTAVGRTGKRFVVIKTDISVNAVTLDGNVSETINGSMTYPLASQYDTVTVVSDGTNWWAI